MRHTISAGVAMLAILTLSGCVVASVTPLSSTKHEAINPEEVVIYLEEADIPGEYEKVAIINTKGESSWTNEAQMYNKAKKEAAKLGANGILVTQTKEPSSGAKIAGAFLGTGSQRTGEMIAIRVSSPSPRQGTQTSGT